MKKLLIMFVVWAIALALVGCNNGNQGGATGSAGNTGENARAEARDEANDASRAADNAGDKAEQTADNAGDKTKDALNNAGDKAENALNKAVDTSADGLMEAKVKNALLMSQKVGATGINVEANEGNIKLFGTVGSANEKKTAENIAKQQDGVKNVTNELQVKPNADRGVTGDLSDAGMEARLKTVLLSNNDIGATGINVEAKNGMITLLGSVKTNQQKQMAEQVVKKQEGVKKVTNKLVVSNK